MSASDSVVWWSAESRPRRAWPRFNEKVLAGRGHGRQPASCRRRGRRGSRSPRCRVSPRSRAPQKVEALLPFATAAVRDAADGQEFVDPSRKGNRRSAARSRAMTKRVSPPKACSPERRASTASLGSRRLQPRTRASHRRANRRRLHLSARPLCARYGRGFHRRQDHVAREGRLVWLARARESGDVFFAVGSAWRAIGTLHMELARAPLHMLQNYEMDAPELLKLLGEIISGKKHAELMQEVARKRAATRVPCRRRAQERHRDRQVRPL